MVCLLVDDDPDDQEIFSMALTGVGKNITLVLANDGADALAVISNMSIDIPAYIFIDVNMPKMNGLECLEYLRQDFRLKDTKVFMYSTISDYSIEEKSRALGAQGLIVKPTSFSQLTKILAETFG